jgi:hypothetical protein
MLGHRPTDGPKEGHAMNFLERALPLIKLGLYVIPVAPPTPGVKDTGKNPLIGDWPNNSTINRKQVEAWYASWPDANVGCVANGKCMLDDDRGDLKEKYEAETGNKFPSQTFSVRTSVKSTGMRGWHFYFNSTVRTIMAGNRKKAGVFDFQCENKHCVGPGTVHWTGAVYEAVGPRAPIADMPDELCAWIERVADAEKPRGLGLRRLDGVLRGRRIHLRAGRRLVGQQHLPPDIS